MPDPIARKRLKKKMLDRWENEGGALVVEPTSASRSTSENKGPGNKISSDSDNATVRQPASPTKRRSPTRK